MGVPISIRLDDDVRDELEAQARARGVGLATLLRGLATAAARDAKRERIRQASATVGRHAAQSEAGQRFYADWGAPNTNAG
jgi:predicted transcriptional regulator